MILSILISIFFVNYVSSVNLSIKSSIFLMRASISLISSFKLIFPIGRLRFTGFENRVIILPGIAAISYLTNSKFSLAFLIVSIISLPIFKGKVRLKASISLLSCVNVVSKNSFSLAQLANILIISPAARISLRIIP